MIFDRFPPTCPPPGWPNTIIDARGTNVAYPDHAGPLSIKCVFRGQEIHEVHGARFATDERSYLVLNAGQRYSSYVESGEAEVFTVFFNPEFAAEALRCLVTPVDHLLEDPAHPRGQPVSFFEKLYPHDEVVMPQILAIRSAVRRGRVSEDWLSEALFLLLERLLLIHRDLYREIEKVPAVRRTTRIEIYRRLCRAKDFIDSSLERKIDLAQVAGIACLSPCHFLRLFRQFFRETPHQYLMRKRLARAQVLLRTTARPIGEICSAVGFESLGSFSHLFRCRLGVSPAQFRAQRQPPRRA